MRLFRKVTHVCQNCVHGNNKKGKFIKRRFRNAYEEGHWHIFCEKKKKYYFWDKYKRCFIKKEYKDSYDEIYGINDNNKQKQ